MRRNNSVSFLIAIILVFFLASSQIAASNKEYNKFSFGINGGLITSFADIKEQSLLPSSDEMSYGGSLFFNFHHSPILTFQWSLLYGSMKGFDPENNLKFNTDLIQADITARMSINGLLAPASSSKNWMNFYAYTGIGTLLHNSKMQDLQTGDVIRYPYDSTADDGPFNAFILPFGLGINFKLSDRIDLGIQSGFVYAFSDELDSYVVPDSRKDMYNYTNVGFTFRLGSNKNSKDWAPIQSTLYPGDVRRMNEMTDHIDHLDTQLHDLEKQHYQDLNSVKKHFDELASGHQELNRANIQLYGVLEDLTERLLDQEALLQEKIKKAKTESFYSVQVIAKREQISIQQAQKRLGVGFDINVIYMDGWYKYFTGKHKNLEDAKLHMQRIWGQGVTDAFIVIYQDGTLTPR